MKWRDYTVTVFYPEPRPPHTYTVRAVSRAHASYRAAREHPTATRIEVTVLKPSGDSP